MIRATSRRPSSPARRSRHPIRQESRAARRQSLNSWALRQRVRKRFRPAESSCNSHHGRPDDVMERASGRGQPALHPEARSRPRQMGCIVIGSRSGDCAGCSRPPRPVAGGDVAAEYSAGRRRSPPPPMLGLMSQPPWSAPRLAGHTGAEFQPHERCLMVGGSRGGASSTLAPKAATPADPLHGILDLLLDLGRKALAVTTDARHVRGSRCRRRRHGTG